jgi:hypothetical protein
MRTLNQMMPVILNLVVILALLPDASGQDLTTVIPDLNQLPAPDWVKEGTRMSYYSAAAMSPMHYGKFVPDEEGNWVDQTGNRYSWNDIYGAAGHGITQVDVLSVGPKIAAMKVTPWQYSVFNGPLIPLDPSMSIGLPAGGDWYINPQALANLREQHSDSLTILRMPYTLDGVTFNAIRIQQITDTSSYGRIYDLESGKLLASFGSAMSKDKYSTTMFTEAKLMGVRQMNLPWLGQDLPSWVQQGVTMQYDGTMTAYAIRAGYKYPVPMSLEASINAAGKKSYTYTRTTAISPNGFPGQQSQLSLAGGIGELGGLVVPPAALALNQPGQIIDKDEITGVTTTVKEVTLDANGSVTIQAANQGYYAEATYDMDNGAMVSYASSKSGGESKEDISLKLTQIK